MKILFYLLFTCCLFFVLNNNTFAQCTGCTTTSGAANGNFTVGAGEKLCLTRNGNFSGNITLSGNAQLCISTNTTITNGANVSINSNGNSIENFGTWNDDLNLGGGNSFTNNGEFSVGFLNLGNSSNFISSTDVSSAGSVNNGNGSTITINGSFSAQSYSSSNNSTLNVTDDFTVATNITNSGDITVGGSTSAANVNNNGSGSISFGTDTNIAGNIQNNGDIQFNGDASVGGAVTNNGGSSIVLNDAVVSVGGTFNNNGDITALGSCGRINIAGASTNNGGGDVGTDGSNVDICDTSSSNGGDFDTNNGNTGPNVTNCTCDPNNPLPITLTSFTAKKESNSKVFINWQTVWEMNNEYFQVERSFSGTDFQVITQISSQKNSEEAHKERNYLFVDDFTDSNVDFILPSQNIYYRLKQIDKNGDFSYSPVVTVYIEKEKNEEIRLVCLQNIWQLIVQNTVQVKVYSSIGALKGVYILNQNQNVIPVSSLPKGMYILRIQDINTQKLTILKTIK
ncbi:hypothetical protein WAF17_00595 [Bernardetia sp. ABR2-2B]|uniref:hypothetical protein n=1 Tax=Bernardetia sp. ABR2-2B TaxID=3127472 RepID=UPI0030CB4E60